MQNGMARTYIYLLGTILLIRGVAPFIAACIIDAQVFGLFQTGPLLAALFVATGAVALLLGSMQSGRFAAWYLLVIGLLFGIMGLLGFTSNATLMQTFAFSLNDNLLNAGVAVGAMLGGFHVVVSRPDQFFQK